MAAAFESLKQAFCCTCGAAETRRLEDSSELEVEKSSAEDQDAAASGLASALDVAMCGANASCDEADLCTIESTSTEVDGASTTVDISSALSEDREVCAAESASSALRCRATSSDEAHAQMSQEAPPAGPQEVPQAAQSETEAKAKPEKVNFTGSWTLARTEGPMDDFMKELGIGYWTRTTAKAMRFGVNVLRHNIKHTEDALEVTTVLPQGAYVTNVRLDGSEQKVTDPVDGRPMLVKLAWSDDFQAISTLGRYAETGIELPKTRRVMCGEEMVIEQTSAKGLFVRRCFRRSA